MSGRLLLLFLLVPAAEIALLIAIGDRLGFGPTLAIVLLTAVAGSWLARREGRGAWRRVQERLAQGAAPGPEIVDGLVVLVSATLLVAPGFLTDIAGLIGLFPPTRALVRRALVRSFERRVASGTIRVTPLGGPMGPMRPPGAPAVEDAEVIDDGRPRTPIR